MRKLPCVPVSKVSLKPFWRKPFHSLSSLDLLSFAMAPARKGTKRAAQFAVEEPLHKKLAPVLKKQGVTQASFKQMVELLEHPLTQLPEECKKMLLAMLPQSLCVPSDCREDVQNLGVTMIAEVVASVESRIREAVESGEANVQAVESSKGQLEGAMGQAEQHLKEAQDAVALREADLQSSSQAVVAAKANLAKKEEEQRSGDSQAVAAEAEQAETAEAFSSSFRTLKEGSWETSPNEHVQALAPVLSRLPMDESLKTAAPPVLMQTPSSRGVFDATVLQQLEKSFEDRLAQLTALLQSEEPQRQARAEACREAKAQLEEAEEKQKECSSNVLAAKHRQKEAASGLKAVEEALAQFEPNLTAAMELRDEKQRELEAFVQGAMHCFTELKDRLSAKRLRELAVEAKAEAKAKAEAEAAEKARIEAEAAEKARIEAEAAEKARIEAEAAEKARIEAEAAEKARIEAEAAEKARIEAAEKAKLETAEKETTQVEAAQETEAAPETAQTAPEVPEQMEVQPEAAAAPMEA